MSSHWNCAKAWTMVLNSIHMVTEIQSDMWKISFSHPERLPPHCSKLLHFYKQEILCSTFLLDNYFGSSWMSFLSCALLSSQRLLEQRCDPWEKRSGMNEQSWERAWTALRKDSQWSYGLWRLTIRGQRGNDREVGSGGSLCPSLHCFHVLLKWLTYPHKVLSSQNLP